MEISKLLNVLKDLMDKEENNVHSDITNLKQSIQNNNTEEEIENFKNTLFEKLENSVVNKFVRSDIKILEKLNGIKFFGNFCKEELNEIINKPYGRNEKFEKFIKERNEFIIKNKELKNVLEKNDFECHFHSKENEYELGFLIPSNISSLEDIKKEIDFIDKFLKNIGEISNEDRNNKITLLNNGSWEIFILIGISYKIIIKIIKDILIIIKHIQKIQKLEENAKFLKNKTIQKELENEEKKIWNKFLNNILNEILKDFNGDGGRKNELKNSLGINLKKLLIKLKEGFFIEIKKPELEKPKEKTTEELHGKTDEEIKKIKENYGKGLKIHKEKVEKLKEIDDLNSKSNNLEFDKEIALIPFDEKDIEEEEKN